jgi:hypothetical protein
LGAPGFPAGAGQRQATIPAVGAPVPASGAGLRAGGAGLRARQPYALSSLPSSSLGTPLSTQAPLGHLPVGADLCVRPPSLTRPLIPPLCQRGVRRDFRRPPPLTCAPPAMPPAHLPHLPRGNRDSHSSRCILRSYSSWVSGFRVQVVAGVSGAAGVS